MQYVPQTKLQLKELMQYISTNRAEINVRREDAEYKRQVDAVSATMRAYFEKNPATLKVTVCPWKKLGTGAICDNIAEQFKVPIWDVMGDAHPSRSFKRI